MSRAGSLLEKMYLKPGELIMSEKPVMITTVLGSCISVTMFHPPTGVAAICHGMLPNGGTSESFKYVDSALRYMVRYFHHLEIPRKELQVKLFGGADMFNSGRSGIRNLTVGWQNIAVASRCLKEYGLIPTAADVGGQMGRKLIFKTDTGVIYIKKLNDQDRVLLGK